MNQNQLNEILENHKKRLETRDSDAVEGCYADLHDADMRGANLHDADLRDADLHYADLHHADLHDADLRYANLHGTNLRDADLLGANIDFSCWPLWCGGLHVHIDDRQAIQLLYHLLSCALYSRNTSAELKSVLSAPDLVATANKFHRVDECGRICAKKESAPCTAATVQGADENKPSVIVDERKEVVKG